jgi:hypothetical protein
MQRTNREAPAHRAGRTAASRRPSVLMLRYTGERASVATGRPEIAPQRFDDASAAVVSTGSRGAGRGAALAEPSEYRT